MSTPYVSWMGATYAIAIAVPSHAPPQTGGSIEKYNHKNQIFRKISWHISKTDLTLYCVSTCVTIETTETLETKFETWHAPSPPCAKQPTSRLSGRYRSRA